MDFEEATLDTAESIVSDVLLPDNCIENIIVNLDDYKETAERNSDPSQSLSTTVSHQNPDQSMYDERESVTQPPFSPRCLAKGIEDYIQNTHKEKSNQVSKDMEVEEATLDLAESIASDVLISESCIGNIIAKLDNYESPTNEKKFDQPQPLTMVHQTPGKRSDQIQPLSMTIPNQIPDQHLYQNEEPIDQTPPSPRCSQRIVEDPSFYFSQDSTQSTLPPMDSQQSSIGLPLSIGNAFKLVFPFSKDRIEKTSNSQQTKKVQKMSEPSVMKQIKDIHKHLNSSLKKGKHLTQADEVLMGNAKQMLCSLKQQQAALCDSFKDTCKRQTPSKISRQTLKKRIDLLQNRQHKLLLLFQEHNAIAKKIKALTPDIRRWTQKDVERQSRHPSQRIDLSLLQTRKEEISNDIVTAFDDSQSESASTVYSLRSQAWGRKIILKSPNLLACKCNTPSQTPELNNGPSLHLDWLNSNSTKMSNDFSRKRSAIPSTNMSKKVSLQPSDIPSTNTSNDFSPEASAIPLTNISNNPTLNTIPSTNISKDFSLMPSTSMSNEVSHKTSAIPSTIMPNNLSLNTIPLTNLSNDCSLQQSAIPSTNMSNDFSPEASDIPSTNMSNEVSLQPSAMPPTILSSDKPSTNMSNNLSINTIPLTNMSNDCSFNSIQSANISKEISKPSTIPLPNMSNEVSLQPSAIPSTNISNESSLAPLLQNLMSQKNKPKSPNSLFSEPNLNTWKEVKDNHNYSVIPQSQGSTYKSPKILDGKTNYPKNNFPAVNTEPNQTSQHNIPSPVLLQNNESSLCSSSPNDNTINMTNNASRKPFPETLPNCQQYTVIPIGTAADFSNGRFLKNISHNLQNFDNKLVPKSVVTSARQVVQTSEMARRGSQNIPVYSRNDRLGTSTNVSTTSAKQCESLKLCETGKSHKTISDPKSKHCSKQKKDRSKKDQTEEDNTYHQINSSLTHLTLIEDQELMPLNSILPSCQNTDSFGSINFPKFLWDGFHIWP